MRILLPIMAAVVPAIILPGFSFYFDISPKIVVLLIGVALALLFRDGSWREVKSPQRWVILLLLAQIVWLAIASAFSDHPALSFNGGNWRRFGFVSYGAILVFCILVILDIRDKPVRIAQYLRATTLASIPISLYGIAQYFGFDPWLTAAGYHAGEVPFTIVRPPSTLGHANYFGAYLVYIPFTAYALTLVDRQSRIWRTLAVAAAGLSVIAILLSGTRAAMLGFVAGLLLLIIRQRTLQLSRLIQVACLLGVILLGLFVSPAGAGLRNRIHWSLDEPLGGARPLLWLDTMQMAASRLLAGYGPETFGTEFPKHESIALARLFPDFQHESPHNLFLDALISQGVPGLLLLIATVILTLRLAFFQERENTLLPAFGAALAAGVISQQFNVFTLPTALFFYLFIALIPACGEPSAGSARKRIWFRAVAAVLAIGFAVFAGQLTLFDYELARSQAAIVKGDIQLGLAYYNRAQKWRPAGSSADLYWSRELANQFRLAQDVRIKLQTWSPAFGAAVQAAATSEERQNAFYNLAIFFATQNDAANVERSLRNAMVWAPNWFKPHWTLAKLYYTQGRLEDAQKEAQMAVDLNGGKHGEVELTLREIRSAMAKR